MTGPTVPGRKFPGCGMGAAGWGPATCKEVNDDTAVGTGLLTLWDQPWRAGGEPARETSSYLLGRGDGGTSHARAPVGGDHSATLRGRAAACTPGTRVTLVTRCHPGGLTTATKEFKSLSQTSWAAPPDVPFETGQGTAVLPRPTREAGPPCGHPEGSPGETRPTARAGPRGTGPLSCVPRKRGLLVIPALGEEGSGRKRKVQSCGQEDTLKATGQLQTRTEGPRVLVPDGSRSAGDMNAGDSMCTCATFLVLSKQRLRTLRRPDTSEPGTDGRPRTASVRRVARLQGAPTAPAAWRPRPRGAPAHARWRRPVRPTGCYSGGRQDAV